MPNSWDKYFSHFSDWDESRCFNVRLELKFEKNIKALGYVEHVDTDGLFVIDHKISNKTFPQCISYTKTSNEIKLSFEVPYDWSIDTDWEDKALVLLGLSEEWVIDSSVEDN